MRVIFSKLARQELNDATHYYDIEYQGLGKRFLGEVRKAAKGFQNIQRHGLWNVAISGNVFYTSSRTNYFILLKKIAFLSLPLRTSTENQITGLKGRKHNL